MRMHSRGFSTLNIALALMGVSLLIGGIYYMNGQSRSALTQKKQLIYPTQKPVASKKSGTKVKKAGQCDFIGKNPRLSDRYDNTDAVSCGSLPAGSANTAALEGIKSWLENALKTCQESKSYIYLQGFDGSIEYLITTNNCEIFAERWGNTEPYCGQEMTSCKQVSVNFPDEVCPNTEHTLKTVKTSTSSSSDFVLPTREASGGASILLDNFDQITITP